MRTQKKSDVQSKGELPTIPAEIWLRIRMTTFLFHHPQTALLLACRVVFAGSFPYHPVSQPFHNKCPSPNPPYSFTGPSGLSHWGPVSLVLKQGAPLRLIFVLKA